MTTEKGFNRKFICNIYPAKIISIEKNRLKAGDRIL
jgi:hypothetical protein